MRRTAFLLLVLLVPVAPAAAHDLQPEPLAVQRCGPAYRYPQNGWIVLHIQGKPWDRGWQHGQLMATEIAAYLRCFAAQQGSKSPSESWKATRLLTNALFLRKFDPEYLLEMKGIAEGASEAGAKFDGRALDVVDIAAINLWAELESLDSAVDAQPTGLEGLRTPKPKPKVPPVVPMEHCSAFAATGPATRDGKIVFGHITMFGLYPARFYNVWLDVEPDKGHRVTMQSFPGGIQSAMDYYINDTGLMVAETTIRQTKFNPDGLVLASRIRKALQYGDKIDDVVRFLGDRNNGLYSNEWLIGDAKTDEIAMFELGTEKSKLSRSSKNEWFGNTPGFYWGCNNTKDLQVRLESLPSTAERPQNMAWSPSVRDRAWMKFYRDNAGKIDLDLAKKAFTSSPLALHSSLDAKITTSEMASGMRTWALFGPPLGKTWVPTHDQRNDFPEILPLIAHPWTVLHPTAPAPAAPAAKVSAIEPIDIVEGGRDFLSPETRGVERETRSTSAAWHGTILPRTDAEYGLTTAWVEYERRTALELAFRAGNDGKLTPAQEAQFALESWLRRSTLKNHPKSELDRVDAFDPARDMWARSETAAAYLRFEALRQQVGLPRFVESMEAFGKKFAGKPVSVTEFAAHIEPLKPVEPKPLPDSPGSVGVLDFYHRLPETIVVYGTLQNATVNEEIAHRLQDLIRIRRTNRTLTVVADDKVTAEMLKTHVLILIGGPKENRLSEKFVARMPVSFEGGTIRFDKEVLAHPNSGAIAAFANPSSAGRSVVVLAGNSPEATYYLPELLIDRVEVSAEVVLVPANGTAKLRFRK